MPLTTPRQRAVGRVRTVDRRGPARRARSRPSGVHVNGQRRARRHASARLRDDRRRFAGSTRNTSPSGRGDGEASSVGGERGEVGDLSGSAIVAVDPWARSRISSATAAVAAVDRMKAMVSRHGREELVARPARSVGSTIAGPQRPNAECGCRARRTRARTAADHSQARRARAPRRPFPSAADGAVVAQEPPAAPVDRLDRDVAYAESVRVAIGSGRHERLLERRHEQRRPVLVVDRDVTLGQRERAPARLGRVDDVRAGRRSPRRSARARRSRSAEPAETARAPVTRSTRAGVVDVGRLGVARASRPPRVVVSAIAAHAARRARHRSDCHHRVHVGPSSVAAACSKPERSSRSADARRVRRPTGFAGRPASRSTGSRSIGSRSTRFDTREVELDAAMRRRDRTRSEIALEKLRRVAVASGHTVRKYAPPARGGPRPRRRRASGRSGAAAEAEAAALLAHERLVGRGRGRGGARARLRARARTRRASPWRASYAASMSSCAPEKSKRSRVSGGRGSSMMSTCSIACRRSSS